MLQYLLVRLSISRKAVTVLPWSSVMRRSRGGGGALASSQEAPNTLFIGRQSPPWLRASTSFTAARPPAFCRKTPRSPKQCCGILSYKLVLKARIPFSYW